jgi:hypothetical protein
MHQPPRPRARLIPERFTWNVTAGIVLPCQGRLNMWATYLSRPSVQDAAGLAAGVFRKTSECAGSSLCGAADAFASEFRRARSGPPGRVRRRCGARGRRPSVERLRRARVSDTNQPGWCIPALWRGAPQMGRPRALGIEANAARPRRRSAVSSVRTETEIEHRSGVGSATWPARRRRLSWDPRRAARARLAARRSRGRLLVGPLGIGSPDPAHWPRHAAGRRSRVSWA